MSKFALGSTTFFMTEKFTEIITSTVDGALERQCADILERIGYEYIIASIT